jgi:hypothetical protein
VSAALPGTSEQRNCDSVLMEKAPAPEIGKIIDYTGCSHLDGRAFLDRSATVFGNRVADS